MRRHRNYLLSGFDVVERKRQAARVQSRLLPVLAGAAVLCAALLTFALTLAAPLVSGSWVQHNATLVWVAVGVLVAAGMGVSVLAQLRGGVRQQAPGARTVVQNESFRAQDSVVIFNSPGARISIEGAQSIPAPVRHEGQIVVGDLPGEPVAFVKHDAVSHLTEAFAKGSRFVTVTALRVGPGAGKTQVAAQYAREAVADGVELVAWVSAADHNQLLSGLAEVARRLGVADLKDDSEVSASRLRDTLAARATPAVLVLDNATDPSAVRPYLPATGATRVVITSTDQAFISLGTNVPVDVFSRAQSVAYLTKRTGLEDEDGANEVARELGDLPLALAQAATVIRVRSLSYRDYLQSLRSLPLDEMLPEDRGDPYPHGTARVLVLSVRAVQEADSTGLTSRVLASAALLDAGGVSRDLLGNIFGSSARSKQHLGNTLAHLVEASLMVWAEDRTSVVMHRLIARAIRDMLQASDNLKASITETASGLKRLQPASEQAWEHRYDRLEIVNQTISLWENVANATKHGALAHTDFEPSMELAHWVMRHLDATADLSRAIEIGTTVLAGCERIFGSEHPDTLTSRDSLALAYRSAGKLDQAIPLYEETLAVRERVLGSEHPDTLTSCYSLATAYESAGRLEQAIPMLEETLAAYEQVLGPEHPNTLGSRNNLASALKSAGKLDQAIGLYEENLAAHERILGPEHLLTAIVRTNLNIAKESS